MEILHIIILSLIQGLSEFLPISSSGHLVIFQQILKIEQEGSIAFDVALHLGTILAILLFFIKDILIITKDSLNFIILKEKNPKLLFPIIASTIPAVIFGFIIITLSIDQYVRILPIIAFNLIFFGILLYIIDIKSQSTTSFYDITIKKGFIIGMAQAISLIPGVSRSGICITASRFVKIDKISALKYSMIISIPSILGAGLLTIFQDTTSPFSTLDFLLGISFSFIFGLIVIKFLINFIKIFSFKAFMIYRILLGLIIIIYYLY